MRDEKLASLIVKLHGKILLMAPVEINTYTQIRTCFFEPAAALLMRE